MHDAVELSTSKKNDCQTQKLNSQKKSFTSFEPGVGSRIMRCANHRYQGASSSSFSENQMVRELSFTVTSPSSMVSYISHKTVIHMTCLPYNPEMNPSDPFRSFHPNFKVQTIWLQVKVRKWIESELIVFVAFLLVSCFSNQGTKMCMMRIVHRIPLIQAVVNKKLQHLTQCFVVLPASQKRRSELHHEKQWKPWPKQRPTCKDCFMKHLKNGW